MWSNVSNFVERVYDHMLYAYLYVQTLILMSPSFLEENFTYDNFRKH